MKEGVDFYGGKGGKGEKRGGKGGMRIVFKKVNYFN